MLACGYEASISELNRLIIKGYIQLCRALHAANYPFQVPLENDKAMLRYGQQPILKPSMQGFRAIKNMDKHTFPSSVASVSISTKLPEDLFSTSA